jgi:hypothetical protein
MCSAALQTERAASNAHAERSTSSREGGGHRLKTVVAPARPGFGWRARAAETPLPFKFSIAARPREDRRKGKRRRQPHTSQRQIQIVHWLDENPLHLIHRHLIVPAIIQRRRARRFVSCDLLREAAGAVSPRFVVVSCKGYRYGGVRSLIPVITVLHHLRHRRLRLTELAGEVGGRQQTPLAASQQVIRATPVRHLP